MAKIVRAKRTGFWDGHRRRAGEQFPVADGAKEKWFEDVGPAPQGTELPTQLKSAQAAPPRGFVQVMEDLAKGNAPVKPQTLAEVREQFDDGAEDLI